LASHRPEEAQNPPGASHRVTSEPLKKEKKARYIFRTFTFMATIIILYHVAP